MHEGGRRAVLTGLHEAEHCLAIRQRQFVRLARVRRVSWVCRSNRWRRVCPRGERDGDTINRRPAGCGTQRSTLLLYSGFARCGGKTSCIATDARKPMKHFGKTPCFRGPNGEIVPGSIAEVSYLHLGGLDQWVMIRGESLTNPPLILLHGGPGFSEMRFFRHFNASLEKSFTVVYW